MLNTSLRRAARSCSRGQPLPPSRPSTPSIAPFTSQSHQRRHSSSKPPVPPNNGSPAIPASAVKQVGASRSETKKPVSESRLSKRKPLKAEPREEVQDNWAATLPSVPSTQHLNQKDVNIAAFYATYRPISVTGPGPREVQLEDVDKLFQPKPKSRLRTQQDVIYTFSSVIENLNDQIEQKQSSQEGHSVAQKADFIKQLTQNNDNKAIQVDGQGSKHVVLKLDIQKITNHFRPFNVPPAPTPVSQADLEAMDAQATADDAGDELLAQELEKQSEEQIAESAAALGRRHRQRLNAQLAEQEQRQQQQQPETEIAEVVFNVRADEDDIQNGRFFTSRMQIENPQIRGFRIQDLQKVDRFGGRRRRGVSVPLQQKESMKLISVKRQRRLKMKKHKYKKLMRKTRNLRRRLGNL